MATSHFKGGIDELTQRCCQPPSEHSCMPAQPPSSRSSIHKAISAGGILHSMGSLGGVGEKLLCDGRRACGVLQGAGIHRAVQGSRKFFAWQKCALEGSTWTLHGEGWRRFQDTGLSFALWGRREGLGNGREQCSVGWRGPRRLCQGSTNPSFQSESWL